jgi:hypothetical protein
MPKAMKTISITKTRIITTIAWIPLTIIGWLIQWILEKRLNSITDSLSKIKIGGIMEILKNISPYIFITFFLIGIIVWVYWILEDRIKSKNEYFDTLESMLIQQKVDIRYLQLQISTGQKDLDLLTISENFSDKGMKNLGLNSTQIYKANQYFKQKYGYEPNRDNK